MKKKKHNRYLGPRCKRMKRPARLQSAKHWLPKYEGKSVIRGYSRHFGVSPLCAALELRILGYDISDERIEQYKKEEAAKHRKALSNPANVHSKDLDGGSRILYGIVDMGAWECIYNGTLYTVH